jgi:hypothetical protein
MKCCDLRDLTPNKQNKTKHTTFASYIDARTLPLAMQTFKSLALKVFYFSLLFAIIGNLVAEFFF